jgi:hypothetical protein
MRHQIPDGVFKPNPTSGEKKRDVTARISQQIIDTEKSAREAKTERLRLAREAKEQAEPVITPVKARARSGKRKAAA